MNTATLNFASTTYSAPKNRYASIPAARQITMTQEQLDREAETLRIRAAASYNAGMRKIEAGNRLCNRLIAANVSLIVIALAFTAYFV